MNPGIVGAVANNSICGVGIAFKAKIGGIRVLDGNITDEVSVSRHKILIAIVPKIWTVLLTKQILFYQAEMVIIISAVAVKSYR